MENIKVSVIVPIYNVEAYLPRCIESLINQTLQEIEIILVNDGSPDNSQSIIEHYASLYPNKIVSLIKENGGLSDARNFGIDYAKGEYISFIDSDDYVDETYLEKMYNRAIESHSEIVVCGYYGVNEIEGTYKWLQKGNTDIYNTDLLNSPTLIHNNSPYAWNKIYHRSLFERTNIRYPKGWIWEDIPTTYPLLACANKISKVDEPLIYYVLKREGSITATYSRKQLQLFQSLELLLERFKELGVFEEFYEELLFINMRHIIFRFKEFVKYRDFKMKYKFVKDGFKHLDTFFPGWRKSPYYFTYYDVNQPFKQWRMKSKIYWYYVILIPNFIHHFFAKVSSFTKKLKKLFSQNNFVKYIYAHYLKYGVLDEKAVLFESFHGTTLSDSPFYMMKELHESGKNMKIYFTTQHYETHKKMIDDYGFDVELVKLNSFRYAKVLATSKYLVNNVSFPPYFMRHKNQKYLNTWHGTPLKTLGKKMVQGIEDMSNMQRNFLHCTDLLYPNDFTMAHMMEDYNLFGLFTGKTIVSGYPRNSIFMDVEKAKRTRMNFHLEDKEVFAYMPTWRGTQSNVAVNELYAKDVNAILERLDQELNDNQILFVNLHSLVKDDVPVDGYKHIFPFPNIVNYEFLNCVDVLISDYSSVFFDFSITKKPIVLFMYDYEEYMSDRGTYFDARTLPFEKIYTLDKLVEYIHLENKGVHNYDGLNDYYLQFNQYDSLDCTQKLNEYFFDDNQNDLQVFDYSYNKDVHHTLYFAPKIVKREDYNQLREIHQLKNPVIVFMKSQFNYLLRESLLYEYNDKVDYIIVKQSIAYTLFERIKIGLSKYLPFIKIERLQMRAFDNLLPNIIIDEIEYRKNPSCFLQRVFKAFSTINKK